MSEEYSILPMKTSGNVEPYTIKIPTTKVTDMETLIKMSPIAQPTWENQQVDRKWGLNRDWLFNARQRWIDVFKWEREEEAMNSLPQFMATVRDDDGVTHQVHFMALFSKNKNAIPVVLFHGWPGSFLEFYGLFAEMKTRYSAEDLPYHLIAPSLIGYAFSSGPSVDRDWTAGDTAHIMHKLMLCLSFETGYVAQGGDIGSSIARTLAAEYDECRAIHLNFFPTGKPTDGSGDDLTESERQTVERAMSWQALSSAYSAEHGTRTATIGFTLAASPVALLAWIGEKFLEWSDKDPDVDEILRSVSLYWLTDTFPRCIYPYRQLYSADKLFPAAQVTKPFGFSSFRHEMLLSPKSWIAARGNLVWFRTHENGGHFAAMECPKEFAQDMEDFVKEVWPSVQPHL